uniref:Uncharacterized protein n=1 Tax=Knipowitschia caucasica TaxID=637954 RepID=A0AAV2JA27_KNICA
MKRPEIGPSWNKRRLWKTDLRETPEEVRQEVKYSGRRRQNSKMKHEVERRNDERRNDERRNVERRNVERRNVERRNVERRNVERRNVERRNVGLVKTTLRFFIRLRLSSW